MIGKLVAELRAGNGGEHGERLRSRNHYRLVYSTPEIPSADDLEKYNEAVAKLDPALIVLKDARKSWYKFRREEIRVRDSSNGQNLSVPLATRSPIVNGLATVNQRRIYVPLDYRLSAKKMLGS